MLEVMNRQFRRAQEKQDKKQEKEKARRREERRERLRQLRRGRSSKGSARNAAKQAEKSDKQVAEAGPGKPAARGRLPGRFSGVLAAVTVFFITLQGVAPLEEQPTRSESLISAGFYLMLGYFATLWFMRRGVVRPLLVSVVGGALLAASVTVTAMVQGRAPDPLMLALVIPALLLGAFLGRLVFLGTPR
jgi:hypothetical protein